MPLHAAPVAGATITESSSTIADAASFVRTDPPVAPTRVLDRTLEMPASPATSAPAGAELARKVALRMVVTPPATVTAPPGPAVETLPTNVTLSTVPAPLVRTAAPPAGSVVRPFASVRSVSPKGTPADGKARSDEEPAPSRTTRCPVPTIDISAVATSGDVTVMVPPTANETV